MKLIEILPNVYGVKVPSDAEYKIENLNEDGEFEESTILILDTLDYLELPSKNFNILGFATKDEISFDVFEIVDKCDDLGNYKNYKTNNFTFWCSKQSFRSALPKEIYFENPYIHLPSEIPNDFILVSFDGGKSFDDSVEWMDNRTCMLAGMSGGNGYFGRGWAMSGSNGCDKGLISDAPDFWIKEEEYLDWQTAQENITEKLLILQKLT